MLVEKNLPMMSIPPVNANVSIKIPINIPAAEIVEGGRFMEMAITAATFKGWIEIGNR